MSTTALQHDRIVFKKTNAHKGRLLSVTPQNSAMKHLSYGRIVLDAGTPRVSFEAGGDEVGLVCLGGQATVTVGGTSYDLGRHDAIYIPRDSHVEVATTTAVDLAECRAPVEGHYPVQHVKFADVAQNPGLRFRTGGPSTSRTIAILLGKNIEAGRIVAGVTTSEAGHWTSWPPHEHAHMLEEMYVYYDMPPQAFGVQFVYTNPEQPELVEIVRDGDAVLMPAGYHPNVSIPGHPITFLWMMAAHRERDDRQFGVVNVQPGFDQAPSGLEAGRK
jgi:5-deoxy-glucuronate isomerase